MLNTKRFLILLLFLQQIAIYNILNARITDVNTIEGIWSGKIMMQKAEPSIIIKIYKENNQILKATFRSFNNKLFNVPFYKINFQNDSLQLYFSITSPLIIKGRFDSVKDIITCDYIINQDVSSLLLTRLKEEPEYSKDEEVELKPIGDEAYKYLSEFYKYDNGIPLNSIVIEREEQDKYVREKVVFSGINNCRIPGYLAYPKTIKPPYPIILQIHGLTGFKDGWWKDDDYTSGGLLTKSLLAKGFAVFAIDAPYHGERKSFNDYESYDRTLTRGFDTDYRNIIIQFTIENRRAIDYLETRSIIDCNRIGVISYSMGSMVAFALNGIEKRVKATIACVLPLNTGLSIIVAPSNFANKINERPILLLMGTKDNSYSTEDANKLFQLINSSKKEIYFYKSDHKLPPEYTEKASIWFKENL